MYLISVTQSAHPACPEPPMCSCTKYGLGSGLAWGSRLCACKKHSHPLMLESTPGPRSLLLWHLSSENIKEWYQRLTLRRSSSDSCHIIDVQIKSSVLVLSSWRTRRHRWKSWPSERQSRRRLQALEDPRCWSDYGQRSSNIVCTCGRHRCAQEYTESLTEGWKEHLAGL